MSDFPLRIGRILRTLSGDNRLAVARPGKEG